MMKGSFLLQCEHWPSAKSGQERPENLRQQMAGRHRAGAAEYRFQWKHWFGPDRTREVVDLTVHTYESGRQAPWPNDLPEEFRQRLLAGIVGFEMPIARIEGKYKLGHNRSSADRSGMLEGLQGAGVGSRLPAEFITRNAAEASRAEHGHAAES
jgi:hypothetical protein